MGAKIPVLPTVLEPADIDLFTASNPRSVINLMPEKVQEAIGAALEKYPEYFNCAEHELKARLKEIHKGPGDDEEILRQRFWMEYERVHFSGSTHFNMANVTRGVIRPVYFYQWFIKDAGKLAWLLLPPVECKAMWNAMFTKFMKKVSQIADIEFDDKKFRADIGALQFRILQSIDARINGAIIQRHEIKQRTEQRNLNVHLTQTQAQQIAGVTEDLNAEDLAKELRKAQKEKAVLLGTAQEEDSNPLAMTDDD